MRHVDRLQRLGEGPDLVELDQDRIGNPFVDAQLQDARVGDKQIITHQLDPMAEFFGQQPPAVPITLVHAVLDRDYRVLIDPVRQEVGEAGRIERLAFRGEQIPAVFVELAARRIQAQIDVSSALEAGFFDCLQYDLDRLFIRSQIRCETALVTYCGSQRPAAQHRFECMKNLGAVAYRLADRARGNREYHELLQIDAVVGMLAAVDDIHHGYGHAVVTAAQRLIQWHHLFLCRSVRCRQ